MYLQSTEGDYVNEAHICRIYLEEIRYKHSDNWHWDPQAKEDVIGCSIMAVTTENIKSDCYQPICLGYAQSVCVAQDWVEEFTCECCHDGIKEFHLCTHLDMLIPDEFMNNEQVRGQVYEYAEYIKVRG